LDDSILAAIERERSGGKSAPKPMEMDDDEYDGQNQQYLDDNDSENDLDDDEEAEQQVHRQTFVYSATLTLPPSTHHLIKKDHSKKQSKKNRKGKKQQPSTVDGAIAEMLDLAGAMGETKVVDLSNLIPEGKSQESKKSKKMDKDVASTSKPDDSKKPSSMAARLPPGLTLGEIRCAQRHKDSHLYGYLVTTQQGSSGPCLVFCNSIAAVRRVGETLQTLGLPVKMLHAQMAQVSVGLFLSHLCRM
jgi:ATP-dependent RNA helicase DDX24/MAK5